MTDLSTKTVATLRRRALVVLFAAALGMFGAWAVSSTQQTTYRARAVVAVPVFNPPSDDPAADPNLGRPLDASRLALSYASLIPEDLSIFQAVSNETGIALDVLIKAITVENTLDTPLIEVVVVGTTADDVAATMASLVAAVTGPTPASASIAPDSLQTVRIEAPVASSSISPMVAMLAGLVLGAAIGGVVAVFWERSQPRIDTASEVNTLIGFPAHDTRPVADESGAWILRRWSDMAGDAGRVLVVPCKPTKLAKVSSIVAALSEPVNIAAVDRPQTGSPSDTAVQDLVITVPGPDGGSLHRPLVVRLTHLPGNSNNIPPKVDQAGVVVMTIPRGTRIAEVGAAVDLLASAGLTPAWAIVHD